VGGLELQSPATRDVVDLQLTPCEQTSPLMTGGSSRKSRQTLAKNAANLLENRRKSRQNHGKDTA